MVKTISIIAAVIAVAGVAFSLSGSKAIGDAPMSGCETLACCADEKAPAADAVCCDACPCDECACPCDGCECKCVDECKDCGCDQCDCAKAECPCCSKCDAKPADECGPKHGCK